MAKCTKCGSPSSLPRVSIKSNEILQQLRSSVGFRDQTLINRLLHDTEKDIDDLNTEIERLETVISVLKHKREYLKDSVTNYRSLLSPIRRLPLELLTLIFLFRCRESENCFRFDDFYIKLPALVLSQVCADWRRVAFHTPAIWNDLYFRFYDHSDHFRRRKSNLLRPLIHFCLERSSQAPLNMSLDFFTFISNESDLGHIFKTVLAPTSHRWHSLKLWCADEGSIEALWSQAMELSNLESLSISVSMLGSILDISPSLYQARHLHCLSLIAKSDGPSDFTRILAFPWTQITTLSLEAMRIDDLLEILRRCINISKLVVSETPGDSPLSIGTDFVTLDRLVDFEFEVHNPTMTPALNKFLSKMTAPALKQLAISCRHYLGANRAIKLALDVVDSFVTRSRCSLSSLSIKKYFMTDSECLSLLHLFPDLKELNIEDHLSSLITDKLLNGLRTTPLTGSLFEDRSNIPCIPRLLHLSLCVHDRYDPGFKPETLNEMVKSRWIPDEPYSSEIGRACLRSIKLVGDKRAAGEPLVYQSLMELERFGLRVEFQKRSRYD
ncbi:hypothetical protein K435DRAFT_798289 [Dendrothele bispora CBS 962.96]|uniref:Uncharacterized protein n=1 Tax=Dendrothele bispora (strain CBS 962.96) TaxID=1314807 RepID=A0A4S8LZN6_DENBC|nr:hypothetical protein K435DRAFT_798289 [Dendrothele bispora CBS 962.96]